MVMKEGGGGGGRFPKNIALVFRLRDPTMTCEICLRSFEITEATVFVLKIDKTCDHKHSVLFLSFDYCFDKQTKKKKNKNHINI